MNKINKVLTILLIVMISYTTYKTHDIIKRNKVLLENNKQLAENWNKSFEHREQAYTELYQHYSREQRTTTEQKKEIELLKIENLKLNNEVKIYKEFLQNIKNVQY